MIEEQRYKRQERTGKIINIQEQKTKYPRAKRYQQACNSKEKNIHELTEKIEEQRSKGQGRTRKIINIQEQRTKYPTAKIQETRANRKDHKYPGAKTKTSKSKEQQLNW